MYYVLCKTIIKRKKLQKKRIFLHPINKKITKFYKKMRFKTRKIKR